MAAVQLPLGVLLDRYGPRRVQSACLLFAAAGAGVFACADGLAGLMLGRALIGVGVATALMASLKAIVLWFPKDRIAFANGWVVMLGALGAVTATLPAEPLVAALGWRGLFALLAAATALTPLVMFLVVPEPPKPASASPLTRVRLRDIYRDIRFLRLAPLSTLVHRHRLVAAGTVGRTVARACRKASTAMRSFGTCSSWAWRSALARCCWVGVPIACAGAASAAKAYYAVIAIVFIAAQMALVLRLPVPTFIPWAIIAAVGAATVLSFAILPEYFPKEMSARANAALNILHLSGAFVLQYLTGVIVSLWPADAGHPPAEAYEAAFGIVGRSAAHCAAVVPRHCPSGNRPDVPGDAPASKAGDRSGCPSSWRAAQLHQRGSRHRQPYSAGSLPGRALAIDRRSLGRPVCKPRDRGCARRSLGRHRPRRGNAIEGGEP